MTRNQMTWNQMKWAGFVAGALLGVACGPLPPLEPPCAASCIAQPGCSMRPSTDSDKKITDPLQAQLNCGPIVVYMNGLVHGVHGGFGSFCPDTPTARKLLHDNQKRGYKPGFCSTCLGVPKDWIFVIWEETSGPTCQGDCPETQIGKSAPLL